MMMAHVISRQCFFGGWKIVILVVVHNTADSPYSLIVLILILILIPKQSKWEHCIHCDILLVFVVGVCWHMGILLATFLRFIKCMSMLHVHIVFPFPLNFAHHLCRRG